MNSPRLYFLMLSLLWVHQWANATRAAFVRPQCKSRSSSFLGQRRTTSATASHQNLLSLQECLDLATRNDKQSTPRVRFVDASWYHKGNRNGRVEFEQGPRIADSVYFDLDDVTSPTDNNLSHMLPSVSLLKRWMQHYGMHYGQDHVIIYGRQGCYFTPRVWFTFRQLGHKPVSLMQASLEEWKQAGGLVDIEPVTVTNVCDMRKDAFGDDDDNEQANDTIDLDGMKQVLQAATKSGSTIILDARGSSFAKGHMPGAVNVPYSSLLEANNSLRFKPKKELQALFREVGVDPSNHEKFIVCTCGSGVSACSLYLALREIDYKGEVVVYDGSWQEWKSNHEVPKVIPKSK